MYCIICRTAHPCPPFSCIACSVSSSFSLSVCSSLTWLFKHPSFNIYCVEFRYFIIHWLVEYSPKSEHKRKCCFFFCQMCFFTYSFWNILLINMDYNKSQISSLSQSAVWVCSPLHPFPAHLLSTKGSCHGDCTRFGRSQSVIPNKSFTHSGSFPFLLHTQRTLQWKEFSEKDRVSPFCTSAGAWTPSQTQQRTSHLCWFTKVLTHTELIIADPRFSIFLKPAAPALVFLPWATIALLNQGPFNSCNNKLLLLLLLSCLFWFCLLTAYRWNA